VTDSRYDSTTRRARFDVPLYSVSDAARQVDVPRTTFGTWARAYRCNGSAPAISKLQEELGIEHVLASRSLHSDGAEVLYEVASTRVVCDRPGDGRDVV